MVGVIRRGDPEPGLTVADRVAAVIAGNASIGAACRALRAAGWRSVLAGNRITVNDEVFVRYIDQSGSDTPTWVVYGIGDRPAIRIVVT